MFGRTDILHIGLVFRINTDVNDNSTTHSDYLIDLQERLQKAYEIVLKSADRSRMKEKKNLDSSAKASNLDIGNSVLVKILAFQEKHKLAVQIWRRYSIVTEQSNDEILEVFFWGGVRAPDEGVKLLDVR